LGGVSGEFLSGGGLQKEKRKDLGCIRSWGRWVEFEKGQEGGKGKGALKRYEGGKVLEARDLIRKGREKTTRRPP